MFGPSHRHEMVIICELLAPGAVMVMVPPLLICVTITDTLCPAVNDPLGGWM